MKENQKLEFKSKWSDELLKVVCAFANSSGGKIYIGINDNGEIVGVINPKKLLKDVIVIEILPSNFPVFYEGKIFVRSGSTTQELTGLELSSFLLEKSGQTWDKLPSDAQEKDLDDETIEKFISLAVLLFGKNPQFYFPSAYTKVGRFKTPRDILDTIIIEGNLFQQLDKTWES